MGHLTTAKVYRLRSNPIMAIDGDGISVINPSFMSTLEDFLSHPIEALERALHLRKQIAALEKTLKEVFGPTPPSLAGIQTTVPKRKGKRTMSAEAKARISEAQKLRWAKSKGFESAESAVPVKAAAAKTRKKGGMSAAGRARIAAAQKARWAKVKAQQSTPAKVAPVAKTTSKGKKRKLSPEARANIVAAVKARWARAKKGK